MHETLDTNRSTAHLPAITNVFAPVPPEASAAGLQFKCDSSHSCDNDRMVANYYSLYATDQIDVTDNFKLRAGVRQDWWNTALTPLVTVPSASNPSLPGAFTSEGTPLLANVTQERNDTPVSWNLGAMYKLFPGVSPYVGASKSFLMVLLAKAVRLAHVCRQLFVVIALVDGRLDPHSSYRGEAMHA